MGKDAIGRRGDIISSALSTIKLKKAPGQAAAVLGLAPLLDQDYLLLSAAQALDATAQPDKDVERLKQAVAGETPAAQAMAAGALAKAAPQEAKEMLSKLLTAPDDRVKLAAARALVNLGERGPLPVFLQLLESENPRMRAHSHQSLRALTGQTIAFSSDAVPEERAKGVAAWKTWLDKEGAAAKLSIPLPDAELPLGRILIASYDQQTLIEFDASRKERWRTRLPGFPWACQGLPNGNRLISFLNQNAIIEFNEDGKEVWRKDRLPGHAQSLQRLPNGNTLIACVNTHNIVEITPSGESTTFNIPGGPACARRLENGNTLISLMHTNRVIEIDKNQKTVWEARNLNGPSCVERLENGNTLVVQQYTGQVVEIDAKGQKTGWAAKVSLVNPTCVKRLPSGTTLITDQNGLHELDEKGEAIRWEHRLNNTTCVSSY